MQYSDWTSYPGTYTSHNWVTDRSVTVDSACSRGEIVEGQDGQSHPLIVEFPDKTRENMTWMQNVCCVNQSPIDLTLVTNISADR